MLRAGLRFFVLRLLPHFSTSSIDSQAAVFAPVKRSPFVASVARIAILGPTLGILAALLSNATHAAEPTKESSPFEIKRDQVPIDGPLNPQQAPSSFSLEPGLRLELVASEPTIASPVALAFDERGRLFVVENRGYPTGPGEGQPPAGRIVRLEDADGDGLYERRLEFADNLTFPNGLLPWNGGLIVTCAPDILWLRDTDGDGRADQREVLLTGFATSGSTQLRVSHPTLDASGWIYVTSGLTGGKVISPKHPEQPTVETRRTDLRFQPGGERFEAADGGAQFGMTLDDFGRRFICYNRVQVQHVVTSSSYWRRNPRLAFADTVHNCPDELAPEPLRGHGQAARLFPLSNNVTTADSHAGTFTAACGVTIWRGANLPELYRGGAFSCDPTGNLVHFDSLVPQGATFAARRSSEPREFLASRDNWFRPVFVAHGPDGALYVCDMYRKTIEHPDYLPVEIRKHTDFESGKTMGRIWRVVRDSINSADLAKLRTVDFSSMTAAQLVSALRHENGWQRDTAARLLLERRDPAAQPALRELARDRSAPPVAVGLAIRLLDTNNALDEDTLVQALTSPAAGVREIAINAVESRLPTQPSWVDRLLPLADDADSRVRFRAALVLGASDDKRVVPALARIAARDSADRWTRAAVFSAVNGRELALFDALCPPMPTLGDPQGTAELWSDLGRIIGASQPPESWPNLVSRMIEARRGSNGLASDQAGFVRAAALLSGLGDALRGRATGEGGVLLAAAAKDPVLLEKLRPALASLFQRALETAANSDATDEQQRLALSLLAHADFPQVGAGLLKLVDARYSSTTQAGAIRALGLMRDDKIATTLLEAERFKGYTPRLREEVIGAMLSNPQHLPGLLSALESGAVPPNAIDTLRRRQLTEHRDASIKARAAKVYASATNQNRLQVYDAHKVVTSLPANSDHGRQVFKRTCASCHRLDREGTPVGPDLFGIRNQPKEAILLHILIPEQEITQGFAAYVVTTQDGRVLTGLLAAETPTSVTLRQALGKEETILRSDIERIVSSPLSLMPQELEKQINHQEFADLLSYLKGEKPPAAK
jgi:putative membrane-bound dehydrogenase-like protein